MIICPTQYFNISFCVHFKMNQDKPWLVKEFTRTLARASLKPLYFSENDDCSCASAIRCWVSGSRNRSSCFLKAIDQSKISEFRAKLKKNTFYGLNWRLAYLAELLSRSILLRTLTWGISKLTITLRAAVEADKNLDPSTMKWESIWNYVKKNSIGSLLKALRKEDPKGLFTSIK